MTPLISIVAPLYNERESFGPLIERLNALMDKLPYPVEVVLVDDGSRDNTADLIRLTALSDPRYHGVLLARNFGHQTAVTAGMAAARGTEAVLIIDGDLQDPPELLEEFYAHIQNGYDVVYAVRRKRKEGVLKRFAYSTFYRILKNISYVDIPLDSGDFSMVSRRVVDIMNKMPEESRFLRGMRSWIGFKQIGVEYERSERVAGVPKYSFKMLRRLAYNGIFNFSEFPVKFIIRTGAFAIGIALIYLIQTLVKKYVFGTVPQGFTALLFVIILFSGIQLMALGIIGEYVLRVFFQVKGRPLFVVREEICEQRTMDSEQRAVNNGQ
ncbi:glycosyltransferase family 2 protein [Rudanella lutea]|uniref:glycosyltransferase family 2 protein n=1 Tax=Rudanella lutea TaxID=451374 RepID=UPI00035DE132|nr:glycosyltransferase family 2 protein [Rudanella lutea]